MTHMFNVPPSAFWWLLPYHVDLAVLDEMARNGEFPLFSDLYKSVVFALLFGVARTVLQRWMFTPLANRAMKLTYSGQERIPEIDAYLRNRKDAKKSADEVCKELCSVTGQQKPLVQRYLWNGRRDAVNEKKVVKFSEALWRAIFYSFFIVLGAYTLFVPETASWILDTQQNWQDWPHHAMSPLMDLYLQLELGCYLHQLFWTEVTRSDAFEMILHHLITIALITISFLNNFTRIGSVILLLHDVADVFLEAGKGLNYISKAKGGKWLAPIVDSIFGLFAVSFFVTRLVLYPRYILWSMSTEGYGHFGGGWPVGWSFVVLLFALQFLHIFWFYLIMRMVVKICSTGTVEKDERSDDEDDFDEEEDEFEEVVSSSSSGAEGKKSK
mmetsp:Transcript_15117/g.33337  ORF Transcript_15117/g.33337 Transcript_15117/m.33337 type:complete len:384 (+) Transcript_15117:84-1235(+)